MFGRKPKEQTVRTVTTIELSDETKQSLSALDVDLQVVHELLAEIAAKTAAVLAKLSGEIVAQIPVSDEEVGVQAFADEVVIDPRSGKPRRGVRVGGDRIRESPFKRVPRAKRVAWLKHEVLADGEWHSSVSIARQYADDEREARYLRHAVGSRLREMHEDGEIERRASETPGVMFEYRLTRR